VRPSLFAALALAAVVSGVGVTTAGTAAAGTNGQHVEVLATRPDNFQSVKISGYNENGDYKEQFLDLIAYDRGYGHYAISDWWWKTYRGKTLQIDWFNQGGQQGYARTTYCDVPVSQPSDMAYCRAS
jgi:hypothetical protein